MISLTFTNHIHHTDAGILANWILGRRDRIFGLNLTELGICIAVIWSSISLLF